MHSSGGLETAVALKLLRSDLDHADEALHRLRDEARVLGHLDHPAIVRAFDIVELDGRLALITELIDGEDLDTCIEGEGALTPRALLQVIAQVADALDAAAQSPGDNGPLLLVHRDIKPSNIRIGRHGQVKLMDFGIAWFAGDDREVRTASEMMVGSLPYMAPERFVERDHHPPSDVFSLACCLFEGLAGEPFYVEPRLRVLSGMAMSPEHFGEVLDTRIPLVEPPEARALLADMLQHAPSSRPTAREVARRCDEIADDLRGASLRLWCADRAWPEPGSSEGSLTGQTLSEGPTEPDPAFGQPATPRIVTTSSDTIDPLMDVSAPAGEPAVPPQNTDRPVAPPAFPSIPVGMAIKNDLISQAEVDTVLQGVTHEAKDLDAEEKPNRLSAPLPEEPVAASGGSNKLLIGVIAVFVLMGLLSVGLVILLAVLGIVASLL